MNTQVPQPPEGAPIPPYNPADYAGQQATNHDPYPYPPGTGDNVSSERSRPSVPPSSAAAATASGALPYFPPPPTAPLPTAPLPDEHEQPHDQVNDHHDHDHNRDAEEGAS
jgi:hypothetical protein